MVGGTGGPPACYCCQFPGVYQKSELYLVHPLLDLPAAPPRLARRGGTAVCYHLPFDAPKKGVELGHVILAHNSAKLHYRAFVI